MEYGWRTAGALGVIRRVTANVLPREMPEGIQAPETRWVEPHIVPGGKHVLLRNRGQLELWSVNQPTCLWVAPTPSPSFLNCTDFDFDLQQEGAMLVISAAYVNIVRSRM